MRWSSVLRQNLKTISPESVRESGRGRRSLLLRLGLGWFVGQSGQLPIPSFVLSGSALVRRSVGVKIKIPDSAGIVLIAIRESALSINP